MNDTVSALLNVFPLLVPEVILGVGACVLFVGATFRRDRNLWGGVSLVVLALAALAVALTHPPVYPTDDPAAQALKAATVYGSPIWLDNLAVWVKAIAIAGGFVLVLCSWKDVPDSQAGEYFACLLIIVAGVCLTGSANELITLFLALELISIPTYVLLYLPRITTDSQEAAMKYFLLSIFSSALLLFGFSYLYGLSGTTNIPGIIEALTLAGGGLPAVAEIALVMVLAGLGFKIAAVPFHFYAPDVYQGTTPSAAALLAFVPKVAGFVALIRVLGFIPPALLPPNIVAANLRLGLALGPRVPILLWLLAAVTMTLGNVLALLQDNLKRLLAYSSVAHAGYMLIGLAAAPALSAAADADAPNGVDAVLFYLVAYGAMTIGAFAIIGYLSTPEQPVEKVDDLAGLSGSHPGIALLMAVFLFSLMGIPLTAGFVGKLLLFSGALFVPHDPKTAESLDQVRLFQILALIGAINAAIGGWYYLRIVAVMYLRTPLKPLAKVRAWPGLAAVWLCALVTLLAGIRPQIFWRPIQEAIPPAPYVASR